MKTIEQLQRAIDPALVRAAGAIRRMAISLTSRALWQLTGYRLPDENGTAQTETQTAEPFTGIGIYARPPASGKPEAIVVMVNDAQNPVVIAVRDEKTRAAIAGGVAADETALFNSQAMILIKANGTIEVRASGGNAVALATKADLDALKSAISGAVTVANDGGASLKTTLLTALASWPVGTSVLRGQ